ncbi:hypothetical protein DPMN_002819 [Dreissena polymorpha]|uniref:Uncharacterized protein n=1 Tax=Dreissena polymorpha TaxID=45954 RepID=A0A9D4MM34_DREPO|nr:hypothetical protein DPMN_002819 [Dreissena polymorpha]
MTIRTPFFNKYYNSLKTLSSKTSCISLARHIFSNVGFKQQSLDEFDFHPIRCWTWTLVQDELLKWKRFVIIQQIEQALSNFL